jgi:hypothetical protein
MVVRTTDIVDKSGKNTMILIQSTTNGSLVQVSKKYAIFRTNSFPVSYRIRPFISFAEEPETNHVSMKLEDAANHAR